MFQADLEKNFLDCKVTEEARFKVGDFVEANVGTWSGAAAVETW